jgi:hypothetical protein
MGMKRRAERGKVSSLSGKRELPGMGQGMGPREIEELPGMGSNHR